MDCNSCVASSSKTKMSMLKMLSIIAFVGRQRQAKQHDARIMRVKNCLFELALCAMSTKAIG